MKKILIIAMVALMSLPVFAQTDFRHISYEEALKAAKTEQKLVFMDFYTDWCGPCKMMMRDVFPKKEVADFMNKKFVNIKLNAEKEGQELAKKYKVAAYPTFIVIDANEKIIMTKVGGDSSPENFIASIARQIDPEKTPERLKARYDGGERTADLISAYAGMKLEEVYAGRRPDESKKQEAFQLVQDYFKGLKDPQKLAPENLFIYTTYTESPLDEIAKYMIAHRTAFDPTIKNQIADRIALLYKTQIQGYMMARSEYNDVEYKEIKKGITDLGLNKENQYTQALRFIESQGQGTPADFLTLCETEFKNLDQDQQTCLVVNFSGLIKTEDEAVLKRASQFLRGQLKDMEASALFYAAQQVYQLENGKH
ncbi:thioredoxin fold domain-containing protein [Bacteroides reticulotermitis]|uniref:Disulphide-isomerase n=2 Tax=Bacteroides reticulotermitis TaxID=1133319 RepID=W4UYM0_9BACE|nr:thioredoxin fold domain-containing protein [Bacteroides reticulotermitis]MBB4044371.1 thioredoxin-related protein [Bacteroides reticulotermitis]GAE85688.1 disulphide-isomerase [Bacteroides reticulotermitis JCM 10512]